MGTVTLSSLPVHIRYDVVLIISAAIRTTSVTILLFTLRSSITILLAFLSNDAVLTNLLLTAIQPYGTYTTGADSGFSERGDQNIEVGLLSKGSEGLCPSEAIGCFILITPDHT